MSRSSSGISLRQDPTISQGLDPHSSSHIQRSSRANSDVIRRSNSPSTAASHQRQTSGSGIYRYQKLRNTSGNSNRNNSTRGSPILQRRLVNPSESAVHQPSSGRGSPMMGQRFLGAVAVDELAGPMLQRVMSNWPHDERLPNSRPRVSDEREYQQQLIPGASHYGSMSSLASSGAPYHHHANHQRSRAGRSLDGADPNSLSPNPYAVLASGESGRNSPIRRVQTIADKSTFSHNGRNSPRMGGASFYNQSSSSARHRHGVPVQMQQVQFGKKPGTSFSSSFH